MLQEKMHEEAFASYLPMNVFARIMSRGVEKGELRKDIPIDYMVHCLFSHLLVYAMAVTAEGFYDTGPALVRPLVYQGILNELAEGGFGGSAALLPGKDTALCGNGT